MMTQGKAPRLAPRLALIAGLLALGTGPAIAQDSDERSSTGSATAAEPNPFYNAFKIQQIESDFDNLDKAFNIGSVLAGFRFPGDLKWLGVEFELSQTIIPGENQGQPASPAVGGGGGGGGGGSSAQGNNTTDNDDLQILSGGVYLVARSTGQYYAGARLGYSQLFQSSIDELDSESDVSYGLLGGVRFGPSVDASSVELEYGEMAGDITALSISFITRFGN